MQESQTITVYYDQSCPSCVEDRVTFERLAGKRASLFSLFDITHQDAALRKLGIEPIKALRELHVKDADGNIFSSIEAYAVMMKQIPLLMPLGFFISLPLVKPTLGYFYRKAVDKRLGCRVP